MTISNSHRFASNVKKRITGDLDAIAKKLSRLLFFNLLVHLFRACVAIPLLPNGCIKFCTIFQRKSIVKQAQLFLLPSGSSTSTFFASMEIELRLTYPLGDTVISRIFHPKYHNVLCRLIYVLVSHINSTSTFIIYIKWNIDSVLRTFSMNVCDENNALKWMCDAIILSHKDPPLKDHVGVSCLLFLER